jgi:hypothetical protein
MIGGRNAKNTLPGVPQVAPLLNGIPAAQVNGYAYGIVQVANALRPCTVPTGSSAATAAPTTKQYYLMDCADDPKYKSRHIRKNLNKARRSSLAGAYSALSTKGAFYNQKLLKADMRFLKSATEAPRKKHFMVYGGHRDSTVFPKPVKKPASSASTPAVSVKKLKKMDEAFFSKGVTQGVEDKVKGTSFPTVVLPFKQLTKLNEHDGKQSSTAQHTMLNKHTNAPVVSFNRIEQTLLSKAPTADLSALESLSRGAWFAD